MYRRSVLDRKISRARLLRLMAASAALPVLAPLAGPSRSPDLAKEP